MITDGTTMTLMLCDMGFIYDARDLGHDFSTMELGSPRLTDEFVTSLATAAAERVGGKVVRTWFDNGAGGYFAEIQVANASVGWCPPKPGEVG